MKQFNIHPFDKVNQPLLESWSRKRGVGFPEGKFLPPTGKLVTDDGVPVAAGFLCKTDSNTAVICSLVSNPDYEKAERQAAIDFLMGYFADMAKKEGFGMVVVSSNIPQFKERISKKGFLKFDDNVTIFGKVFNV